MINKITLLVSMTLIGLVCSAQSSDRGHIYFIRTAEYKGWTVGYPIFIDDVPICKVNNKKFTIQDVMPGKHTIKVQVGGKKPSSKVEAINVDVEIGKDYYFQITSDHTLMSWNLYLQEITESSAKRIMPDLEKDTCL